MFKAACIQINSRNDMEANVEKAVSMIREAADGGADLITLPENVAIMSGSREELFANAPFYHENIGFKTFSRTAKELKKWILIGGMSIKDPDSNKLFNRSFLIDGEGEIAAQYDKIHLYDVEVEGGESHMESSKYNGGKKAVIADTPWAKLGLTICYDVRFPYLYRALAKAGASVITVPAAFTQYTGQAHWHVLLRARAIETGCYIIAPAQTGSHPANRKTYGHSLIISPWGEVLADAGEEEGVIIADIDLDKVTKVRAGLPSLEHDRVFEF